MRTQFNVSTQTKEEIFVASSEMACQSISPREMLSDTGISLAVPMKPHIATKRRSSRLSVGCGRWRRNLACVFIQYHASRRDCCRSPQVELLLSNYIIKDLIIKNLERSVRSYSNRRTRTMFKGWRTVKIVQERRIINTDRRRNWGWAFIDGCLLHFLW